MSKVFVVGARGIPDVEGGAEKSAERIFPLIAARGWRVILAGLKQHIKSTTYRGVELRSAPSSRFLKTDKLLYYISAVFMALKLRPDVVHMQGLGSAIMLWAYKLMGAKTVVRYGSADYLLNKWGLIGRWGFLISEYQLRFADAVIAVTPALAERLNDRGISGNVHVIRNATDTPDAFADATPVALPNTPYVLAVGRVTGQKNLHRLIEGFKHFAADRPDLSLVIAGGLDDEIYVQGLTPLLSPRVRLLGRLQRSNMGPLYANAHIYVNASIHEGMSNAVLEAISWGAPVLLSAIPENLDFELDEKNYFDPEDVAAIAAALERANADRQSFVADRSAFPTWDMVAERTTEIYESFGLSPSSGSRTDAAFAL